jgi:hypothetical protein
MGPTTGCSLERGDARRVLGAKALTSSLAERLAHPGPRPNALPLHDVRYRKARTPKGPRLSTPLPFPKAPRLKAARAGQGDETDRISSDGRTGRNPETGGARRDRTDDLMLAKHALSQLSYGPLSLFAQGSRVFPEPQAPARASARLARAIRRGGRSALRRFAPVKASTA